MWWRRKKAEDVARRTPFQEVLDLRERVEACETTVLRLDAQFRQLRGYVYAKKGAVGPPGSLPPGEADIPVVPPTAAPVASAASKDEIRRQLAQSGRFLPGKPPKHSETGE